MKKVYKSPCKINIFLKVTGTRDNYHEIASRFVLLDEPHDVMWFEPGNGLTFEIIGDFDCDRKDNTIYKAYHALLDYKPMKKIAENFAERMRELENVATSFEGIDKAFAISGYRDWETKKTTTSSLSTKIAFLTTALML